MPAPPATLDRSGQPVAAGHAACASCHATDFAARAPTTCGGVPRRHRAVATAPRRPAAAALERFRGPAAASAITPRSRAPPVTGSPPRPASCARHAVTRRVPATAATPPPACPPPHLAACAACHQRGLERSREREGAYCRWSRPLASATTPSTPAIHAAPRRSRASPATPASPPRQRWQRSCRRARPRARRVTMAPPPSRSPAMTVRAAMAADALPRAGSASMRSQPAP